MTDTTHAIILPSTVHFKIPVSVLITANAFAVIYQS